LGEPIFGVVWLIAVFGATEVWYRTHENRLLAGPAWRVEWPAHAQPLPIADTTRAILRYNNASSAAWRASGSEWWGFYARWKPHRTAAQLARSHSPEICLPAIGRNFEAELDPLPINLPGAPLSFRCYRFSQNAKPLFVFVCLQDDNTAPSRTAAPEWSTRGRLEAAWSGRRNLGQRLLELALLGANDSDEAERAAMRLVPEIVWPAITD
jgi:hypothetical protein